MLYIIVPIIICIITIVLAIIWKDFSTIIMGFLLAFFSFSLTLIIGTLIVSNVDTYIDKEKPLATYEICALQDNFNFYLNYFCSNDYLKYNFLYNDENGIITKSVCAEDAYIHFSDEKPKVIKYAIYPTNPILKTLFLSGGEIAYDIYIPEGSIATEYNIDLK